MDLPLNQNDLAIEALERARTIPSSWYTQESFHAIDNEAVLSANWHYVGSIGRLKDTGDYLTAEVAGNPLIIVKGKEGELRAFFNVCKHRGGPLAMDECGHARMLQCKYHGWTYHLDGSLRGVPKFDRSELFDKKDFGLTSVRIATWEGLVFVDLSGIAPGLSTVMDGIADRIGPGLISSLTFHSRVDYRVHCNWKVYVDNYLEGYHLPLVHPELCDAISYADYVTETFPYYSLQHASFRDSSDNRAFYFFIYPNTMLNILPDRLQVNSVIPLANDRTRVIFDYYYRDIDSESAKEKIEEDQNFADKVQQEDIEICEYVQKGLESRAYDQGRFSPETEAGVHHFQSLLKASYRKQIDHGK